MGELQVLGRRPTPPVLRRILAAGLACIALLCTAASAAIDVKQKEQRLREIERMAEYDPRDALAKGGRALAEARDRGDKPAELDALLLQSIVRANLGEFDSKEDEQRGEALARELGDMQALSWFLEGKAWSMWWGGRREEGDRLLDEVIAQLENGGFEYRLAWVNSSKGMLMRHQGRKAEAMDLMMKSYAFFERNGHRYGMAAVLKEIGEMYGGALSPPEDQARAIEYFQRSSALLDKNVHRMMLAHNEMRLGLAYQRQGEMPLAKRHLEAALEAGRAMQFMLLVPSAGYHLASIYEKEGRPEQALAMIERVLPTFKLAVDKHIAVGARVLRAELLAELGRKQEAQQALADTAKELEMQGFHAEMVGYHERIAAAYERLGDYREAYREMQALRVASLRLAEAQKSQLNDELRVRFDVQLKESENARLRAEKKEADTQRLVVALALAFTLLLFASIAYFLRRRATAARTEAQHHKALAEAEASANQAKSTFLANMSHELRSPLNAVLGFNRLLARDRRLPQDAREDLGIAVRSGEHLYTLINQVLDLSKIESGHVTLVESDFSLPSLLEEMSDMFGIIAADKKLQLSLQVGPGVPEHVRADAVKLRQVLINLLGNAFKFTREGGVTVHVSAESDGAACRLSVDVEDTGPGIEAAELAKLGGAFVQAQAGLKAREGTGLGLAISRGFIELMGGSFHMHSMPGQGTTIGFQVPVKVVESAERPAAPDTRRRMLAPGQPRYRILAVDDRAESRQLLRRLLTPMGFEVREAGDGAQAVAEWQAWRPHLIWMDMRMPVMDGREATRTIRASEGGQETVIVALTASSFDDEREAILADGCDDFMRKPFKEEALFETMARHLGVQFVFEDDAVPPGMDAPEPQGAVPQELLAQLDAALARLDSAAIDRAVAAIGRYDAGLARELSSLADDFEYTRMREVISQRE